MYGCQPWPQLRTAQPDVTRHMDLPGSARYQRQQVQQVQQVQSSRHHMPSNRQRTAAVPWAEVPTLQQLLSMCGKY